jgi:signal transduction histidine kinase
LHETIQDVIQANRRRQENAGIRIDANLKAADDLVLANPVEMRQIFTNLISNAFDAMESSPERALAISSRATSDNAIRIDFADTGVGISPAIKTKLFEPLMTTKSRGLGVGLSITRSIVEEHEGQIWAEPNPGGGAVFTVVLPVEKAPAS